MKMESDSKSIWQERSLHLAHSFISNSIGREDWPFIICSGIFPFLLSRLCNILRDLSIQLASAFDSRALFLYHNLHVVTIFKHFWDYNAFTCFKPYLLCLPEAPFLCAKLKKALQHRAALS